MAIGKRIWLEGMNGKVQRVRGRFSGDGPSRRCSDQKRTLKARELDSLDDLLDDLRPEADIEVDDEVPDHDDLCGLDCHLGMDDEFRGTDYSAEVLWDGSDDRVFRDYEDEGEDEEESDRPALMQSTGKLTMAQLYPTEDHFRILSRKLGLRAKHFRGFLAQQFVAEAGNRNG